MALALRRAAGAGKPLAKGRKAASSVSTAEHVSRWVSCFCSTTMCAAVEQVSCTVCVCLAEQGPADSSKHQHCNGHAHLQTLHHNSDSVHYQVLHQSVRL